ncbi:hypothetical protein SAY86_018233 [Trapa natans]|uniref:RRM domain-containing protein n=1 Tax=Trapa natans TaxID=22666 RepID=A0AAN7LMM6_TRANT|nr:hypothetical protein SAY86_018233 [Trapa natans]
MGVKERKLMKKTLKKASADSFRSDGRTDSADFLPLEGGPARKLPEQQVLESGGTVLYIGRLPHGFYEEEIKGFFSQFGTVKRLRVARNKKTGKSKHFGFIQFESPEVAKIVAETMHNYLLAEHMLQVHVIPPENVHSKLWRGVNYRYKPVDQVQIQRKEHNKERTLEEHSKLVKGILKRDKKRRKKIEAAGIDYECPEIVGSTQPVPKKIKFN